MSMELIESIAIIATAIGACVTPVLAIYYLIKKPRISIGKISVVRNKVLKKEDNSIIRYNEFCQLRVDLKNFAAKELHATVGIMIKKPDPFSWLTPWIIAVKFGYDLIPIVLQRNGGYICLLTIDRMKDEKGIMYLSIDNGEIIKQTENTGDIYKLKYKEIIVNVYTFEPNLRIEKKVKIKKIIKAIEQYHKEKG